MVSSEFLFVSPKSPSFALPEAVIKTLPLLISLCIRLGVNPAGRVFKGRGGGGGGWDVPRKNDHLAKNAPRLRAPGAQ
jgi:hypothetical protein